MSESVESDNLECELRFAHIDGHTEVDFLADDKVITAGSDCEVRLWSLHERDDVLESFSVEESPYSLAASNGRFFLALASNCVKSYCAESGEQEQLVCRFAANATHLAVDADLVAAASADFSLKLVSPGRGWEKVFSGHSAPVLSVAIDPLRQYLASSSCDGSVWLWSVQSQRVAHSWHCLFPASNDVHNSTSLCRLAWQPPGGQLLALPRPHSVEVYGRAEWHSPRHRLQHARLQAISIVAFSHDGLLLAAASAQSTAVVVWRLLPDQCCPLATLLNPASAGITSVKFSPRDRHCLCCCDSSGALHILRLRRSEKQPRQAPLSQPDLEEIDAEQTGPVQPPSEPSGGQGGDCRGESQFDIGAIKSHYESLLLADETTGDQPESPPGQHSQAEGATELRRALRALGCRQGPFQPGSTPAHLEHRVLVWNSVGVVWGHRGGEEDSIDVEFHDGSAHPSLHLSNECHYSLAALSPTALLLASADDPDCPCQSRLFCLLLSTWDSQREWQVALPPSERVQCVCAGSTFLASVSSNLFLRVFTLGGIQTSVLSVAGPAVSLCAHHRHLMLLYHCAPPSLHAHQHLAFWVLRVDHVARTRAHPLPAPAQVALSPGATVQWAGFSDEGTPCVMDSAGVVRLFKTSLGANWFPVCLTRQHAKGKSDHFFLVGLSEIQAQIRVIYCKASRYPDTVPKPSVSMLALEVPLCESFSTKSKLEDQCIRSRWLSSLLRKLSLDGYDVDSTLQESQKKLINSLIKLFALALGAERESLALEIARLMPDRNALEGAVRYAERQRHRSLALKLLEMVEELGEEEEEGDNSDTELHQLATARRADRLRQVLPERDQPEHSVVSLAKTGAAGGVSLRPKRLAHTGHRPLHEHASEPEEEQESEKPKSSRVAAGSGKNPFGVGRKRKGQSEWKDCTGQSLDKDPAFLNFYESTRPSEVEANEGQSGEESIAAARKAFARLDEAERRQWGEEGQWKRARSDQGPCPPNA